jgi:uncharacterized membrane protein
MHLIPQSWAHLHILVSVFPSVGLIFALGFHIAGLQTNNAGLKRLSLVALGILGLLAIPTYLSGDGASTDLAANPKFTEDLVGNHYGWAMAALGALVITGLVAWITVFRMSDNALHLVLGLGLITLGLMAVSGELGWEINHTELNLPTQRTPQIWSHVHIIVNHVPTVGFVFALVFYIFALILNNVAMKRASLTLFVICGIFGVPTFVTGNAAMLAVTEKAIPGITKAVVNAHRDFAIYSLFGLAFTGVTSWLQLWRYRHLGRFSNAWLGVILLLALGTLGILAETGHRGGQINHPEIRVAGDVLPTDAMAGLSQFVEHEINQVIWFVPWQTVHFFGFALIFGVAFATSLRVLGFWKSVPFSAVHRILPLGVFGVATNVFSGMLILQADSPRYLNEITFVPKVIFITIGAVAVLYFSLSERLWQVKAGEDAPMSSKWVAALVLISWIGVIMGGRLLPYV